MQLILEQGFRDMVVENCVGAEILQAPFNTLLLRHSPRKDVFCGVSGISSGYYVVYALHIFI